MNTILKKHDLLLATAQESRLADERTIKELSISGDTLMEIAGNRAADILMADYPDGASVLFVIGKGNNAGDALVISRLLLDKGFSITLFPIFGLDDLSPDAETNVHRLNKTADYLGINIPVWDEWKENHSADVIVDGIFGTGLIRDVEGYPKEIIQKINHSGVTIYALDIPSGLHCDSGDVLGTAIQASKTIQFGIQKLGCYMGEGPVWSGERVLAPLPFPECFTTGITSRLINMSRDPHQELARSIAPKRSLHKYNNGVVHVIGGSTGLTGAPYFSAKAAWSAGIGAVLLHHPAAWLTSIDILAPDIIKKPIGSSSSEFFQPSDADPVLGSLEEKPGIAIIGPGLGRKPETLAFVRLIVEQASCPLIIDADALAALPGHFDLISQKQHPETILLTPHPGELTQLTTIDHPADIERLQKTKELAHSLGCSILSKGNPVFFYNSATHDCLVTPYDTSPFSRAGFGDILCGHIGAFLSRGGDITQSCEAGLLFGFNKMKDVSSGRIVYPGPIDLL